MAWDPFLESPGNLTGPDSDFEIKVSRKEGCVLTSDEVHFVSLADNFNVQFSNLLKLPLEWKIQQRNGPGNYRELRETGPWPLNGSEAGVGLVFLKTFLHSLCKSSCSYANSN